MLRRAGNWFLRSGIQRPNGGVARYYRSDTENNARVSTEITGYAIGAFFFLAAITGDDAFREAGLRAARFLTRCAWNPALGTFPFEHSDNGDRPPALAYFFDCGIVVRGLLTAWRATGEPEFLKIAADAGRSLMTDFCAPSGIHPILRLPGKQPLPYEPKWSATPGCYQLKSAMAWRELFEETGEAAFQSAYEAAAEDALRSEHTFLPGDADPGKIMDRLHAYCYFLEGLLPCLDHIDCRRALSRGLEKTTRYLRETEPLFVRSDVYAQLLRLRLHAAHADVVSLDEIAAAYEAANAADFQLGSADARLDGGFAFGRKGNGMLPFINPVSTAFCLQALALWSDHNNRSLDARRQLLI